MTEPVTAGLPDRSPPGPADDETTAPARARGGAGRRRRRAVTACLGGTAVLLAGMLVRPEAPAAATDPVGASLCFGAAAMEPDANCSETNDGPTVPSADDARDDRSPSYQRPCQVRPPFTDRLTCEFGDTTADRNVALVGNSHAVHWLPALHEVGLRKGFKVTTYISAMCFATTVQIAWRTEEMRRNCLAWGDWVRDSIAANDYDLVVQTERTYKWPAEEFTGHADDVFTAAYRKHLESVVDSGKTVLVIRDTPMPAEDVPTCLSRNPEDYRACSTPVANAFDRDPLVDAAESFMSPRVRVADLTRYFCKDGECPAVIGRVVAFFDASHVTATYSRTLAPYLAGHVSAALQADAAARSGG